MERLTERTPDGIIVKEGCEEDALKAFYQCYGAEPMPHYENCDEGYCAMDKLAELEDLEEQCTKQNSWGLGMLLHKWDEFFDDIQELYEYRKLEEQGMLLKLPVAEMSTVYEIIYDTSRCSHCFGIGGCYGCEKSNPKSIQQVKFWASMRGRFNKDIFLTHEEAEAALKEMSE